jgi:hypothetical protein
MSPAGRRHGARAGKAPKLGAPPPGAAPLQIGIYRCEHLAGLLSTAMRGDLLAGATLENIADWMRCMEARPVAERLQCLDCETAFHSKALPESFAMTTPFIEEGRVTAIITGICEKCGTTKSTEHLLAAAFAQLKAHNKSLHIIASGSA